jgi:hypothetical protein
VHTNDTPDPLLLTPRDAAATLAVSERTLWTWTAPRGPLACVRLGRAVRYDRRDLVALVDKLKNGGNGVGE